MNPHVEVPAIVVAGGYQAVPTVRTRRARWPALQGRRVLPAQRAAPQHEGSSRQALPTTAARSTPADGGPLRLVLHHEDAAGQRMTPTEPAARDRPQRRLHPMHRGKSDMGAETAVWSVRVSFLPILANSPLSKLERNSAPLPQNASGQALPLPGGIRQARP
jgi:hypothetical protein